MLLILERIQNRDMKTNKGLEHLSFGEKLKTAGTVHLREEKAQEESYQ